MYVQRAGKLYCTGRTESSHGYLRRCWLHLLRNISVNFSLNGEAVYMRRVQQREARTEGGSVWGCNTPNNNTSPRIIVKKCLKK